MASDRAIFGSRRSRNATMIEAPVAMVYSTVTRAAFSAIANRNRRLQKWNRGPKQRPAILRIWSGLLNASD